MVRIVRLLGIVIPAALAVTAAVAVAQSLPPSLFTGTVVDANGSPVGGASITASMGGEVCGQATSIGTGAYAVTLPDSGSRPAACSAGGQVDFTVNGSPAGSATKGGPGIPVPFTLTVGAPTATPAAQNTLVFNSEPGTGVNSASLLGPGVDSATVLFMAKTQSGHEVSAIWFFQGGLWKAYVPTVFEQFSSVSPPAALYFILQ